MKMNHIILMAVLLQAFSSVIVIAEEGATTLPGATAGETLSPILLPSPSTRGDLSVEEALQQRRSFRDFSDSALKLEEIGQITWAAQGITSGSRFRTAPSAGATYPLELYVIAGNVESLKPGLYRYIPQKHSLELVKTGDLRSELATAALGQKWVRDAPASLVIGGVVARTAERYGDRAERYMLMEAGHAAQNVFLQALSCHLGSVMIGAFQDDELSDLIGMKNGERPLAIIPVGR